MKGNSLCPLFWQHHEEEIVLRQEIARMDEAGVGSFIVESRPIRTTSNRSGGRIRKFSSTRRKNAVCTSGFSVVARIPAAAPMDCSPGSGPTASKNTLRSGMSTRWARWREALSWLASGSSVLMASTGWILPRPSTSLRASATAFFTGISRRGMACLHLYPDQSWR